MYLTDRPYPARFHREYAPTWLASVLASLGRRPPALSGTRFLEIGCGTGLTLLQLAAANPAMQFHGIDLNPAHIRAAQATAAEARIGNARFTCGDIANLPPERADFIVSHGMYSWVSTEVRAMMRRFVGASLAPGGIACIHYMTAPGGLPFRAFHAAFRACRQAPDPVGAGLSRLVALRDAGAGFFQLHPHASDALDGLLADDPDYIAHDYLNAHFDPLDVAEVMADMAEEGLGRVGSAAGIENIDAVSLPAGCAAAITSERDPALREAMKDIARNQSLRYDLFMRPAPALGAAEHMDLLREQRFGVLAAAPKPGRVAFSTRIGPVEGEAAIFGPLLSRLHAGAAAFAELERLQPFAGRPGLLNQALQMLQWAGAVHPLRSGAASVRVAGLPLPVSVAFGTAV
ncbi:class I SAM-dependent methyltransferase [Cereibacter sp. SYSU M97828]|nr:class I SAM-dependent methyltransferase [Cereibacter flavus]